MGRGTIDVIPTKTASEEKPEFAGDYILKHVFIGKVNKERYRLVQSLLLSILLIL